MGLWSVDPAFAGHAGDVILPSLMPHEMASLVVGLVVGLAVLAGLSVFVLWRLRRLERRLKRLEIEQAGRSSRS
jgi:hypothetical protein